MTKYDEQITRILQHDENRKVSPKLEAFRNKIIGGNCDPKWKIKGCRGGRGAGAKSFGMTSLIAEMAHFTKLRIACLREIQQTLEESVLYLIKDRVEHLGYKGWDFKREHIDSPSGSHFIFKGLKDLRASRNIKGLAKFDLFFIEEAATISMESWNLLIPTIMRNEGAELWFCYNPEEEIDPVTERIWNRGRDDALLIELKPGKQDNPWWPKGLQDDMEDMYKNDPDEAEHVYGGQPRKQGHKSVMARAKIRQAMDRNIIDPVGMVQVGCDPADFGDDKTEIYIRQGLKVIAYKTLSKMDGVFIANEINSMIKGDPSIPIYLDTTGIGVSTRDQLKVLGLKVIPINFAENATNQKEYDDIVTEMWYNLKEQIDEIDIPDDPQLMKELAGRQYGYDNKGRRKIESKKLFKDRYHKSPDKADALILCFFQGKHVLFDEQTRKELASRRNR